MGKPYGNSIHAVCDWGLVMEIGEAITYLISVYNRAVLRPVSEIDDALAFALWKTMRKVEEENNKCQER